MRTVGRVQQDGRLPDDPALLSAEADTTEPIVKALITSRLCAGGTLSSELQVHMRTGFHNRAQYGIAPSSRAMDLSLVQRSWV